MVAESFEPDELYECDDTIVTRCLDSLFYYYFLMDDYQFIRFFDIIYEMLGYELPKAFKEYVEELKSI